MAIFKTTMKKEIESLKKVIRKSKQTDSFSRGFQLYLDIQKQKQEEYAKQVIKEEQKIKKEVKRIKIKEQKLRLVDKYRSQKDKATILKEELNKRDMVIKSLADRLKKLEKDAKKKK